MMITQVRSDEEPSKMLSLLSARLCSPAFRRELLGELRRPTLMRFIACVSVLLGLLFATGSPAAADCSGPTIRINQREVVRGGELAVHGDGWGDNCYDTGPPPEGEGVLGVPIGEIEVYVVQGTDEFLVATGAADAEYSFDVTVVVPPELMPGDAMVQARWASGFAFSQDPEFVVTDAAPLVPAERAVATFQPATTTTPVASATPSTVAPTSSPSTTATPTSEAPDPPAVPGVEAEEDSNTTTVLVVGAAGALVALLLAVRVARRKA